jgi:hypothetical protein
MGRTAELKSVIVELALNPPRMRADPGLLIDRLTAVKETLDPFMDGRPGDLKSCIDAMRRAASEQDSYFRILKRLSTNGRLEGFTLERLESLGSRLKSYNQALVKFTKEYLRNLTAVLESSEPLQGIGISERNVVALYDATRNLIENLNKAS